MIIDCKHNPDDLINKIGDPYFLLCDDSVDEVYRHKNHPKTVTIMDCESEICIDITSAFGAESTMESAKMLLKLLNQEYKRIS